MGGRFGQAGHDIDRDQGCAAAPQVEGHREEEDAECEGGFTKNDVVEGEPARGQRPRQGHVQTGGREDEAKDSEVQCPSVGVGSGWVLQEFAREEHEPDKRDAGGHRHDRVVRGHFCPVDLQSVVGLRQSEHAVTLGAVGGGRRTCEFVRRAA